MAGSIANRLSELGIELPKVAKPLANYLPFVVTGNLVLSRANCQCGMVNLCFQENLEITYN